MITRTFASTVLALGLLSPIALAAENTGFEYNSGCSMDQTRDGDFIDCKAETSRQPFAVPYTGPMNGDYGLEGSTQSKAGVSSPSAQ